MTIDAAVNLGSGSAYLFSEDEVLRYNIYSRTVDPGFPKRLVTYLPDWFEEGVDAAVNWGNGKAYFFRGNEYVSYDIRSKSVESGFPKLLAANWPGWFEEGVDAAVNWGTGAAYFFRGNEFLSYNIAQEVIDLGTPNLFADFLPFDRIDAAVDWGNGKAYFFRGNEYARYDIARGAVDPAYPRPFADFSAHEALKEQEVEVFNLPEFFNPGYSVCDFIDERITVEAQRGLYAHLGKGVRERNQALHVWAAVKYGILGGIFLPNQQRPALMAQRYGTTWWNMIPEGRDAELFPTETAAMVAETTDGFIIEEPPILVFREQLAGELDVLGSELVAAWYRSGRSKVPVTIPLPSGRICDDDVGVGPVVPDAPLPQAPDTSDIWCPQNSAELASRFEVHWNAHASAAVALYGLCHQAALMTPVPLSVPGWPHVVPDAADAGCDELPEDIDAYLEPAVCSVIYGELAAIPGCDVSLDDVVTWYREWR